MIRERYFDHVHSGEMLDVLSLDGSLACLLDLRLQAVTMNHEMQDALQIEDTELSFSQWIASFHKSDQYEIRRALNQLLTEELRTKTVHVLRQDSNESFYCKMLLLTNGQVAFTLSQPTYSPSFPNQPAQQQFSTQHIYTYQDRYTVQPLNSFNKRQIEWPPSNHPTEDFAANLVDKFPHGLTVINHNWEIMYVNHQMEQITGLENQKQYERLLWDVYPIEEYYNFFQHFLRAMETQKTLEFEGVIEKTGTDVKVTVHPIEQGIMVFTQDITLYKEHVTALEESEEKFANLANNMKDVFCISDASFDHFFYISPAFQGLFGPRRRDMYEDPCLFFCLIHEEDQDQVNTSMQLMKKQRHEIEYRITDKDGEQKWIRTRGFPVEHKGDRYIISLHEDITECKEMIQLKEQSQQLSTISQMSAGIAHEIKNPLTSIKGFLQIGAANPELRDNYQDIILDEVNRIESIVQDFMMLSKPKSSMQLKEVDPNTVISYVLRLLEPEAASKNVHLSAYTFFNDEVLKTEPKRLNQILVNLVKNAIDAVEKGGEVIVSGDQLGKDLSLTVTDNGPGLTPEQLDKIGEPFFTTKEKGTGLGVMVTKKMVKDLNGTIDYQSQVDEGTSVTVRFPR